MSFSAKAASLSAGAGAAFGAAGALAAVAVGAGAVTARVEVFLNSVLHVFSHTQALTESPAFAIARGAVGIEDVAALPSRLRREGNQHFMAVVAMQVRRAAAAVDAEAEG